MPHQADILILGQGLAGSTLAWRLVERGLSVIVVDRGGVDERGRPSASRIAAGLITPVTGKRLTVATDYEELWRSARDFYRGVETTTGAAVLTEQPALRVFKDAEEHRLFLQRASHGEGVLANLAQISESGVSLKRMQCGAFVMPHAARLNVPVFLQATARWLGQRLIRSTVDTRCDLNLDHDDVTVERLGIAARLLVLCQGHAAPPCRWLDGVNFSPAKGEVLTIRSRALKATRVVHRGVWIAPEGDDIYRVGSTTEWHRLDSQPTSEARRDLLDRLADAGVTDAEVIEHQAAVRPATPDRRPTYGFSPKEPRIGWFNGLGAKGALWAPWHANRMADLTVDSIAAERGRSL